MKEMLKHQCNVIYECKICKSMYRDIKNFLKHKQKYCKELFCDNRLPSDDDHKEEETVVVVPEDAPNKREKTPTGWDDYPDSDDEKPEVKKEKKVPVWEQIQKGTFKGTSSSSDLNSKVEERTNRKTEGEKKKTILKLDHIPGTKNAMKVEVERNYDVVVVNPQYRHKGPSRPKKHTIENNDQNDAAASKVIALEGNGDQKHESVVVVEPEEPAEEPSDIGMNLRQSPEEKRKSPVLANKSPVSASKPDAQQPATPGSSSKSRKQTGLVNDISEEDMIQIQDLIDEETHQCLKCYAMFGTVSNLHRHAIRHLGPRRFRCTLCSFESSNHLECRKHLKATHDKAALKNNDLDAFIERMRSSPMTTEKKSVSVNYTGNTVIFF